MALLNQRCLAVILGAVLMLVFAQVEKAWPHSWYQGKRNPVTGEGCCGVSDCIPVDVNRITETETDFIVDGRWHFPKIWAEPSPDGLYHMCIWGGKARCFFFPANV